MSTVSSNYLGRMLDPVVECFTPELANQLINLRPDPAIQSHIDELAAKANEGTLTPDERAEYQDYVEAIDVISILQLMAKGYLSKPKQR